MKIQRIYTGSLNKDDSDYKVPQTDHVDARNICTTNIENGMVGDATAELGNRLLTNATTTGTQKNIGAYFDRNRNCIYEFRYSSTGEHLICKKENGVDSVLLRNLTQTGGVDILNWNQYTSISSVAVVHRDEGDLLYWVGSDFRGNQTPCKINVSRITTYGTITADYISAAKKPPLLTPGVTYMDDSSKTVNALRAKMFQFKYRWVYDDFEKSTWSPISEVPLPNNVTGTDIDLDGTKNNKIRVTVTSGKKDVIAIEVAARNQITSSWTDFYQIAYIVKSENAIVDDIELTHDFFNDAIFPQIDILESNLLFDWLPRKANCLALVNGDTIVYGGITEGYDRLRRQDMNVSLTVANITNNGIYSGGASLTYYLRYYTPDPNPTQVSYGFAVTGSIPVGTRFRVLAIVSFVPITLCDYTSVSGDTIQTVLMNMHDSMPVAYQNGYTSTEFFAVFPYPNSSILTTYVDYGTNPTGINTPSTWNWASKYKFGLVYFDAYGRTNGVMTYIDTASLSGDFEVNTPNFEVDGTTPKTPVIDAGIYHYAPSWAVRYMWVRTPNLAIDNFIHYVTADVITDTDYIYFCLGNLGYYKNKNSKFNYSELIGTRLRVMCGANNTGYTSTVYNADYEVLGIEQKQITGGGSTEIFDYVKVKKPVAATAYPVNLLVCLYTPAKNTSGDTQVYYEFGPSYEVYSDGTNYLHKGQTQDQTASLPATFQFQNGDVYYKPREIYYDIAGTPALFKQYYVMDVNYSDYFQSAVNGNGRPEVIDVNAKEQYFPVMVRFSQSYVQDTNINGLNRFYFDNMDSYNRSFSDIRMMVERDKELRVYQKLKVGHVPVYQQIIKDASGGDVLAQSDRLLNKIQYRSGNFGIGDCPESLVSDNFADYFVDNRRGVICRNSVDGITPISFYKMNTWATEKLKTRGDDSRVYGVFDRQRNRYIICLEASTDAAETLSFDEGKNRFEGFHDYFPERIVSTDEYLVSYKNGLAYSHDSGHANYYGVQYKPSITFVYNDGIDFKKTFTNISLNSNVKWDCEISTSTGQTSSLNVGDFRQREDGFHAGFLRDIGSPKGLLGGDTLKGNWVKIKFESNNSSIFVYLTSTSVNFIEAPLNKR